MLSRVGVVELVPAVQRLRAQRSYKSLPPPAGSQSRKPSPEPEGRAAADSGAAECVEAEWTEVLHEEPASVAVPTRAQQINEAYRATDPIQPRPGLFLRITA